jgi:hypothetical protein
MATDIISSKDRRPAGGPASLIPTALLFAVQRDGVHRTGRGQLWSDLRANGEHVKRPQVGAYDLVSDLITGS